MARPKSELGDIRTSARSVRLLRWLRRKPQPAKLLGETADGEEVTCAISATGPAQWTDVLSVVRECEIIKALDKDGNELRRIKLDPSDPELRAESEMEQALERVSKQGGSVPIISVDIPKLVDNLARNMREVAGEAARQQSNAFKEGFGAMTSVVNLCLGLLVRMDQRLNETENALDAVTTHGQPVGEPEDPRAKMAMAALKQAMGGAANGSGAPDMAKLMQLWQAMQQQNGAPQTDDGDES